MLFLYLVLAVVGLIFFGVAGCGALVLGLYACRLNRYRYQHMGLPDRRAFPLRFWRQWKFSLYQPVLCVALALFTVLLLSLILKPLTVGGVLGDRESEAALRVGSIESKVYALTEWLKSDTLVHSFLAMALTLLVINLIWPNIKLFEEVPKLRVRIRSVLIFLTTISVFTFVSSNNINTNRTIVTAQLKSDALRIEDEIHGFNSESAAYKIVKDSIDEMSPEEIRNLAMVVRTVVAFENARQISESLGKEAGEKLKEVPGTPEFEKVRRSTSASALDEVEDWPTLNERKVALSNQAKRADLLRKASRESMLVSLDKISLEFADQLGSSWNAATKSAVGTFFSSLSESVAEICSRTSPRRSVASDTEMVEDFAKRYRNTRAERLSAAWLEAVPEVGDVEKLSASIAARSKEIDADLKLRSAGRAADVADDAADGAKAAKKIGSVLRLIF